MKKINLNFDELNKFKFWIESSEEKGDFETFCGVVVSRPKDWDKWLGKLRRARRIDTVWL